MKSQSATVVCAIVLMTFLVTSCTREGTKTPSVVEATSTSSPMPATASPLPSATPIPTVIEPGLAYGIPCKPPCWRGLIPGGSTRRDVERAIEQVRVSGWAYDIADGSSFGGGYGFTPSPFTSQGSILVAMDNDVVKYIDGSPLFYYPLGTLVEQFGDPEKLHIVTLGGTDCSSCEDWEPPEPSSAPMSSPLHLLYPSQGLWFLALVPFSGMGCICPEMKVIAFCYYAPVSIQEAMNNDYLAELCVDTLTGVTGDDLVEWHGFGGGY